MDNNLIFDIGTWRGQYSQFYLNKGFRVVAVEANPEFYKVCKEKCYPSDRYTIINAAIASIKGFVDFYISKHEDWCSCNIGVASRAGQFLKQIKVPTVNLTSLFEKYGVPYYLKIDIEGNDVVAVRQLNGIRPQFISCESECVGDRPISEEEKYQVLNALAEAGYTKFKFVNQVSGAVNRTRECVRFNPCSLPWELPCEWVSYDVVKSYIEQEPRQDYTRYCIWADIVATY